MAIAERSFDRIRWVASCASGVAAVLLAVSVFRLPRSGEVVPSPPTREVRLQRVTSDSSVLGAASTLRDLTPLFLPTDRNASLARLAPRAVDPAFYQAPVSAREQAVAAWHIDRLPPPVTLKDARIPTDTAGSTGMLQDFLDDAALEGIVLGIGRSPVPIGALEPRGGVVEVVALGDGRRVLSEALATSVRPPSDKVWQPLVLLANVGRMGLVSPLSLDTGSGIEEVDLFFQNYLARNFRIAERLPPGFYRITVAP